MGLERFDTKVPGTVFSIVRSFCCVIGLLATLSQPVCEAFNLDEMNPTVYSGPEGSFFGYAVEFYLPDSASASVVIGAPKANTSQINITEGGSVFYCPWSPGQTHCDSIEFDTEGDRFVFLNETKHKIDFKSHQWFGATVRSHGDTVLACAPLYSWRTEKDTPHSDVTGTCYLSVQNFTKFVEYAPCRTEFSDREGQGYCQGGFSADFTMNGKVVLGGPGSYFWQGQVISAAKENIIRAYYPGYFIQAVDGQMQTKQGQSSHDDNYQGYSVAVGEFSGDEVEALVSPCKRCLPHVLSAAQVSILNGTDLTTMVEYTGEQMGSYFGYALATTDINNDGMTDLLVGAPMFIVRGSDSHLEEMGRVYVYLQRSPLKLELRLPHQTGTQMYGRFGSSIAALGDLNQDGFNDVAISCPFGGEDQKGLVYIFNGFSEGLREKPSQVIKGQWAAGAVPPSFGFSLRGAKDLDMNGYPDLIVGAFGVDKAVLYRYVFFNVCSDVLSLKHLTLLLFHLMSPLFTYAKNLIQLKRVFFLFGRALSRRKEVYLGDDNSLTLIFNARNEGEGGAYEAELHVVLPPEADYSGIARNNESFAQLTCSYEMENQTRYLSCDLGNPMRAGANLWAGLRFTVPRLKDTHRTIQFELQIPQQTGLKLTSQFAFKIKDFQEMPVNKIQFKCYRLHKDFLSDMKPKCSLFFQLKNNGPSHISHTSLDVRCPLHAQANALLYRVDFSTKGPINCTLDKNITHLNLKVSFPKWLRMRSVLMIWSLLSQSCSNVECWTIRCNVGLLEKGTTALVKVRSRLRAETFMEGSNNDIFCNPQVVTPVVWNKPDIENFVPLWIIILAILAGLLLLAVLIYVLYRVSVEKQNDLGLKKTTYC
uniref:Integrin, alpha 5 (fibronectin receptor, alpha polypeptide) n=1 Tax=Oryzias sinensis TaxID=183150 RepID=A0A8C7WYI7_9TELE